MPGNPYISDDEPAAFPGLCGAVNPDDPRVWCRLRKGHPLLNFFEGDSPNDPIVAEHADTVRGAYWTTREVADIRDVAPPPPSMPAGDDVWVAERLDLDNLLHTATAAVLGKHYPRDIDTRNRARVRDQVWTTLDVALRRVSAILPNPDGCVCGDSPMNYDGPVEECPQHGDPDADRSRQVRELQEVIDRLRPDIEGLVPLAKAMVAAGIRVPRGSYDAACWTDPLPVLRTPVLFREQLTDPLRYRYSGPYTPGGPIVIHPGDTFALTVRVNPDGSISGGNEPAPFFPCPARHVFDGIGTGCSRLVDGHGPHRRVWDGDTYFDHADALGRVWNDEPDPPRRETPEARAAREQAALNSLEDATNRRYTRTTRKVEPNWANRAGGWDDDGSEAAFADQRDQIKRTIAEAFDIDRRLPPTVIKGRPVRILAEERYAEVWPRPAGWPTPEELEARNNPPNEAAHPPNDPAGVAAADPFARAVDRFRASGNPDSRERRYEMPVISHPAVKPGTFHVLPAYAEFSREVFGDSPRIEFGIDPATPVDEDFTMTVTIDGRRYRPGVTCHECNDTGEIVIFEGRGGPDPQPPESEPCYSCTAILQYPHNGIADVAAFIEHLDGDTIERGTD